jgi:hypothetical protein
MQILLAFEVMYQRVSRGSTGSWWMAFNSINFHLKARWKNVI